MATFPGGADDGFIGWQADIVGEYAGPDQFVTTCIDYARPAVEDDQLAGRLNVTSGNAYYEMQEVWPDPITGICRRRR